MAENRLPLIRGKMEQPQLYESTQGGGGGGRLPERDAFTHGANLLRQIDLLQRTFESHPGGPRDERATRTTFAVEPAVGAKLDVDPLGDAKQARLIGVETGSGIVLLDAIGPELAYLRKKIEAFGDESKVTRKTGPDGTVTIHRKSEAAVAPIETVRLATPMDLQGPALRSAGLPADQPCWLEIGCRGGYRAAEAENDNTRQQVTRQLSLIGVTSQPDEFLGPEVIYFFTRLSWTQAEKLIRSTDCVYEVELAPAAWRDSKLFDEIKTSDITGFKLEPPHADAPAVALLDTGIASNHPLLRGAILSATTATAYFPSPEDTFGHGTNMAGIALHPDLGGAIQLGQAKATHWLQSCKLVQIPGKGLASDDNYEIWPVLTQGAVDSIEAADPGLRGRAFALAITRSLQDPPLDGIAPTLWSHAVDLLAFGGDRGRLFVVSAGNAREDKWAALAELHPQLQITEFIHEPAQASNAITVGAYTERVTIPAGPEYAEHVAVATQAGGISPYTSSGLGGNEWAVKPDIVMEGGNLAYSGILPDIDVPTLCAITTSHRFDRSSPIALFSMTSEATARAARLAVDIWRVEPRLRPATIRGLLVHAAAWTPQMKLQFPGIDDRLRTCGYGVPNPSLATACAQNIATIFIEGVMPSAVAGEKLKKIPPKRAGSKATERVDERKVQLFRLPIPAEILGDGTADVELRVTLSYFAEPNKFKRTVIHGLDLKWDMQGPQELEHEFIARINKKLWVTQPDGRTKKNPHAKKDSFNWQVGINRRSRGTVQSDRWSGKMADLVGDKLIAVMPVLGWWEHRKAMKYAELPFSLIVSVFGPGVYSAIKPRVEAPIEPPIEPPVQV